jgi:hypothetical protein
MTENPYKSPASAATQLKHSPPSAKPKRRVWPYVWNFGVLVAAACYTWQMTDVLLQLYGLHQKLQPTGNLYVNDVLRMVEVAALIAWSWFLAGSVTSWTWTKVRPAVRWLYAAGFTVFLVGTVVRVLISRWYSHFGPNDGVGDYVMFVVFSAVVAFPIVVYGTGYIGLIANRFKRPSVEAAA